MKTTATQNQSSFSLLPQGLKAIIFEYLPLSNFSSLALVCHDFNLILSKRSDLWANHIFKSFLTVTQKDMLFMDEELLKCSLKSQDLKRNFYEMVDSKGLLIENLNLRQKFKVFLSVFLSLEDCEQFVKDIFEEVRSPNYPVPCLKKDVHHFSTKTLFQNFLTEVYFEINGKSVFPIKKQRPADKIVRQIRAQISDLQFNYEDLVNIRWYLFDAAKDSSTKSQSLDSQVRATNKTTQIKENPLMLKREVQETKPEASGLSKLLCLQRSEPEDSEISFGDEEEDEEEEAIEDCEEQSSDTQVKTGRNPAEDLYWMLHSITENHCKMAFTYLNSIEDPHSFLYEYTRLWNKFTLIVISFNQTFAPFASVINKVYDEECSDLPTFPEFSTWRLMVKIWIDQVFLGLKYHLNESFRFVLMTVRNIEEACSGPSLVVQRCLSCSDNNRTYAGSDHLYNNLFYKPSGQDSSAKLDRDASIKLLRGFSDAIDDISYNEFTIFYWDCSSINKETPKGALESLIIEDSKLLYNHRKECLEKNSTYFRKFLKDDLSLIESLMGKPFSLELKNQQIHLLRELLPGTLREKIHNNDLKLDAQRADNKTSFEKAFKGLCMSGKIQRRKASNEENPAMRTNKINGQESPSRKCLAYLLEDQKDIELQTGELDEMRDHRHLRGFLLPDQKHTNFLELCQNPSRDEIETLGVDGRNVKEDLESLEDKIIFL